MCKVSKILKCGTVVSSCRFFSDKKVSEVDMSIGRPSDAFLVNYGAPSFASSAAPVDSFEADLVVGKNASIGSLLRWLSNAKIGLSIIQSCSVINVINGKTFRGVCNFVVHCYTLLTICPNRVINASLHVSVPCKSAQSFVVPGVHNSDLSLRERNKANRRVGRLLNFRSYQLQFSLPLLDYNTSGVEVYYR